MPLLLANYVRARGEIRDADLLALRKTPGNLASEACSTGGEHCHVGMAAWWQERLMILELRSFHGGTAELLSRRVADYGPGSWDVLRYSNPREPSGLAHMRVCDDAVNGMIDVLGVRYNWSQILGAVPHVLPIVRDWLPRPVRDWEQAAPHGEFSLTRPRPWVCSTAVSRAWSKFAGVDPRPDLADRVTYPSDLTAEGKSIFRYQFTIGASYAAPTSSRD